MNPYTWFAIAAAVTGPGTGAWLPAANNATLQFVPENAASLSGLRGMFRQAGGLTGLPVASSVMKRSGGPGQTEASMFLGLAMVTLPLPLTFLVLEHRGAW